MQCNPLQVVRPLLICAALATAAPALAILPGDSLQAQGQAAVPVSANGQNMGSAELLGPNARPVQAVHNRLILVPFSAR